MATLTTRIPDETLAAYDQFATEDRTDRSTVIREALDQYATRRTTQREQILDRIFEDRAELFERLR